MSEARPAPPTIVPRAEVVLVVDDRPESRGVTERYLQRDGFQIESAATGPEALEIIASKRVDLVLLDILLPGMTGQEVLAKIGETPLDKRVPVVVLSVDREPASIVKAVELGADDYLFKPVDRVLLRARVGACLEKKRLHDLEKRLIEQLRTEQERSERLLLSILPPKLAERLKRGETRIADHVNAATILVAGIHDWARHASEMEAIEVVELLGNIFAEFDTLADRFGVEKVKTTGSLYIAAAGVSEPALDHAERAAELALEMQRQIGRFATRAGDLLTLRAGMDSGPVVAGVVGASRVAYDVWGQPVVTAGQMELSGVAGGVQVTGATQVLLAEKYELDERGSYFVQGSGEVITYLLKGQK